MYSTPQNRVEDRATLVAFMRAHSFVALVTARDGVPIGTHLPCAVEEAGDALRLIAHMARANPQWREFDGTREALVVFGGPHAYISPRHYESTVSVPTWNYVAVHAYGRPRVLDSRDDKIAMLERLIRDAEPAYLERFAALPADYREKMLAGIAAFEISVERVEARFKLSQEKLAVERGRIVADLECVADSAATETAALMRAHGKIEEVPPFRVVEATGPEDIAATHALFREYQQALGVDLCFQGFDEELATLPGKYAPPDGRLFLAKRGDAVAGCIALRRLDDGSAEVKRLYVRPAWRGFGLGPMLAKAVLDAARAIGYRRLVLDTLADMKAARALYQSLGFHEIASYYENPLPGAIYMALDLAPRG
jgi:transcriptional regulator